MRRQIVMSIIFAVACVSSPASPELYAVASPTASPAPSLAPVPPRDRSVAYTYETEITVDSVGPHRQGGGAIDEGFGILDLTFNRDGNITGTYKSDVAPPIRITGGRTGPLDLWIAIGSNHFQGRFTAGGFAVTTPVITPRNGIERVFANTNIRLIATFLHADPAAP